jgi:hypothetical protein
MFVKKLDWYWARQPGLVEELTGSMRNSVIALILFFAAGLWFLVHAFLLRKNHSLTG